MNSKLWSVDEVADYLGVPKQTLYQWRTRRYGPPGCRVGKYVRYMPDEVEAWVKAQKETC